MAMQCPICGGPITQKLGEMAGDQKRWITFRRWNDAEMRYDEIRTWHMASEAAPVSRPPFLYVDTMSVM